MMHWIRSLDRALRGQTTRDADLADGNLRVPVLGFLFLIDILGMAYGACMGLFSLTPGGSGHAMQMLATTVKVPALFLLTLLVTFPSLYVFNALVGSPLLLPSVFRLLVTFLAVMLATLASIGPIVGFFSFTTTSYSFIVLLNVLVFSISGFLGLLFLLQTMSRISLAMEVASAPRLPADPGCPLPTDPPSPLLAPRDGLSPRVRRVFQIWVTVFGLVGAQMAWVLRPFIGKPGMPFAWFRSPHSNFFEAVLNAARELLS